MPAPPTRARRCKAASTAPTATPAPAALRPGLPSARPSAPPVPAGGAGTGNGAAGGTTCPPAPSCADGDPCAGAPGSTMQSCTDSSDGYTATCCFPLGELPPTEGSQTGSGGGADAGNGRHEDRSDRRRLGRSPPQQRRIVATATATLTTRQPQLPDAGAPPPPSDAGATACRIKAMPSSGAGTPCGVTEVCPANGAMYRVPCDGTGAPCSCFSMGQPTSTTITASCTALRSGLDAGHVRLSVQRLTNGVSPRSATKIVARSPDLLYPCGMSRTVRCSPSFSLRGTVRSRRRRPRRDGALRQRRRERRNHRRRRRQGRGRRPHPRRQAPARHQAVARRQAALRRALRIAARRAGHRRVEAAARRLHGRRRGRRRPRPHKLLRTLESGQDPESFDLSRDGKTLYVSNEETAEMSVLDLASGKVKHKVPVGHEPEGSPCAPTARPSTSPRRPTTRSPPSTPAS